MGAADTNLPTDANEWARRWGSIPEDRRADCLTFLRKITDPSYVPVASSEFAVNRVIWYGPEYASRFIPVREVLTKRGFIEYGWGLPITPTDGFAEFVDTYPSDWANLLSRGPPPAGVSPVAPPAPTALQAPAISQYPAETEDAGYWERINALLSPVLEGEVAEVGEILYIPTANLGGMKTGGRYSRPDLTYIRVGRYPLSGHRFLDLVSVEAKTWKNADNVANAYESVAYKRFSTHVYYAYESPDEKSQVGGEVPTILRDQGVGIIRFWREGDSDKMRIDQQPSRGSPSPDKIEDWLTKLDEIDDRGKVKKLLHVKFRA